MTGYNLLWITFLLLAVHHSRRADSFQCYECENCPSIDEGDFKYLKECVLPDNFIVRPTTTAAPVIPEESYETEDVSSEFEQVPASTLTTSTTSAATLIVTSTNASTVTSAVTSANTSAVTSPVISAVTTAASSPALPLFVPPSSAANETDIEETLTLQNGTASDEEFDLSGNSTLLEDAIVQNTTEAEKKVSNTSAESLTTLKKKKASSWSLLSNSREVPNFRSVELAQSGEVSQRSQLPGTKPMCYVLTIKYDGYEVTNRGCGAVLPDRNLTCKMLSKGQPYSECGLCDGNKCNSASRLKMTLLHFLFVLVLIAVCSW